MTIITDKSKEVVLKYIMTMAIIAISILRKPQLMYQPRFYAEEGQAFFSFAYNNSFIDYLLTPMFGYYALYNVIATALASKFPLEIAPLITIYESLVVQIIVSSYVIWCDISILNTNLKRFMVAISFPLLCPSQIWLTTIGVQYWLCILTLPDSVTISLINLVLSAVTTRSSLTNMLIFCS